MLYFIIKETEVSILYPKSCSVSLLIRAGWPVSAQAAAAAETAAVAAALSGNAGNRKECQN